MKAMKFKVSSPEHSKVIQEKLFEMGYGWGCGGYHVKHTDAAALYAGFFGGKEITYGVDEDFDKNVGEHNAEEHFLINDAQGTRFVTKDYWTQPKTPEQKPVASIPKPPLGLRPRDVARRERITEIIAAMKRYDDVGMSLEEDWVQELYNLVKEGWE